MRLLITGASGFVGGHLRRHLLETSDWELLCVVAHGDETWAHSARETVVTLDLREPSAVRDLLIEHPPDAIVHLAAQAHVPASYDDPWGTLENNIRAQLNLLQGCVGLAIKPRTLVVGSSEEYGRAQPEELPLREEHPLRPENPYSLSKVAQDLMGYSYHVSYGLPVVRMRPFSHTGPGQTERFALPAFARQVARIEAGLQEPVLRVGNLAPARDFTDVRDVVRAYELALLHAEPGEPYNVCSGEPRTIASVVDGLLALTTVDIRVEMDPSLYRPADTPVSYGSAEKLHAATGWSPQIPFERTLVDVLQFWRGAVGGEAEA